MVINTITMDSWLSQTENKPWWKKCWLLLLFMSRGLTSAQGMVHHGKQIPAGIALTPPPAGSSAEPH